MQLALQLESERGPIAAENGAKVVVFLPIGRNLMIDLSRFLVKDGSGIAVGASGGIDRLPDVELFARTRVRAECRFVLIDAFDGDQSLTEIVAHAGLRDAGVGAFMIKGVLFVV